MDEYSAKTDGRAIHEDEFARHPDRALLLQCLVHLEGLSASVLGRRHAIGNRSDAIFHERPINEAGPDVERIDQLLGEAVEAPGLIGMDDARPVAILEA